LASYSYLEQIVIGYHHILCCAAVSAGIVGFQFGFICFQFQSDSASGLTHPDTIAKIHIVAAKKVF